MLNRCVWGVGKAGRDGGSGGGVDMVHVITIHITAGGDAAAGRRVDSYIRFAVSTVIVDGAAGLGGPLALLISLLLSLGCVVPCALGLNADNEFFISLDDANVPITTFFLGLLGLL